MEEGGQPLHASWAAAVKKTGGDPEKIEADLQAAITKYGAGLSSERHSR